MGWDEVLSNLAETLPNEYLKPILERPKKYFSEIWIRNNFFLIVEVRWNSTTSILFNFYFVNKTLMINIFSREWGFMYSAKIRWKEDCLQAFRYLELPLLKKNMPFQIFYHKPRFMWGIRYQWQIIDSLFSFEDLWVNLQFCG